VTAKHRWYEHVPAATAVVPCEGQEHHVTWRWGKFKIDDHDLGGERALLDLGGEPNPCLRALQLWADQFGMRPEQFGEMRRRLGADAVLLPKELDVPREVGMALSLERAWKKGRYMDMQGRLLEKQLKDRATPAVRAHLAAEKQRLGSRMIRAVQVRLVRAGTPAAIEGRMDSVSVSATVTLSSDWIVTVWCRPNLAVADGALVLEVTGPGPEAGTCAVRAARWRWLDGEPRIAEPVIVRAVAVPTDDGYRLTDEQVGRGI
jgi:hypothetical protein